MDRRSTKGDLKNRAKESLDQEAVEPGLDIPKLSSSSPGVTSSLIVFIWGGFFGVLLTVTVLSVLGTLPSVLEAVISAIIGGFITLFFNATKNNK